jgi:hypothetical protein
MRTLSPTLLAAQKGESRLPYLKVVARNKMTSLVHLKWEKLHSGNEPDYYHSATIPGDGSLIRVRISPSEDNNKLYHQRITNPGPLSDFASWTYSGQYGCQAVTVASHNNEVCIFWVNLNQELKCVMSNDYGSTWGNAITLDYSPYPAVEGISAVYKTNGNVAAFFTAGNTLYLKERINSVWQVLSAWDKDAGYLTSVAAVYDGDWDLVVTGQDTSGNYKLWSLVYGDGGAAPEGVWSELQEITSAPAGGCYEFGSAYLDKSEVFGLFYVETFIGVEPYNRPFRSSTLPETQFLSSLWHEPVPFNVSSEYGVAIAHSENYLWLSCPFGVWRASIEEQALELTKDVLNARIELMPVNGKLDIELQNSDGKYCAPGTGILATLNTGCQLDIGPGYVTAQASEVSNGLSFWLEAFEHISTGGKSSLLLHATDGWQLLEDWRARSQFRWNQDMAETSIKKILEFILVRVGLKLEIKSESTTINEIYPDFTVHPGDTGITVVSRLLSYVPDLLFMEGINAALIYPQESDSSTYSYGQPHIINRARYYCSSFETNQIRIEGVDEVTQSPLVVDTFDWQELEKFPEKFKLVVDRNIGTLLQAQDFGVTMLRRCRVESTKGAIQVPVNCGQQMYDVIDITDTRAGLLSAMRRVVSIVLEYRPAGGVYTQQFSLGGV